MSNSRYLGGIELRYALTMQLLEDGPSTVPELVDALSSRGFGIGGRPSKSISDALRWEIRRGRVRRLGRGRYAPAYVPRGTEYRIHKRALALRAEASELSLEGGQKSHSRRAAS